MSIIGPSPRGKARQKKIALYEARLKVLHTQQPASTNGARFDSLTLALANDLRETLAGNIDRLVMADEVALAIRFVVEKYPSDMPLVRAWLTSRGIKWNDNGYVVR